MTDPRRRDILRFSALLAGVTPLAGCGGGGDGTAEPVAAAPPPSPAPPPAPPAPSPPAPTPPAPAPTPPPVASSGARQFSLLSAVTQTAPFCVGFALRRGDIPSGSGIAVSGATAQVTVKSTWPDGSAKIALVAGTASLTASAATTVALAAGTSSTGTELTLAGLQAAMTQPVTVSCGSFGSASWTAADWASPFETWVVGHRMSSWTYRKQVGNDAHLVAWLEVRYFSTGEVEVLPWVENGYLLITGPTSKSGTYTFAMGGTTRFSAAVDLPHHCRTVLVSGSITSHWLDGAHDVVVKHDGDYMQTTGLVPAYLVRTPASAIAVVDLPTSFTPLQRGIWPNVMGSGGYHRSIGLLPEWDAAYLTSSASATYKGMIFQAYSAGRYAYHFRDEADGNRPARLSRHPTLQAGRPPEFGYVTTPATSGTAPPVFSVSHQPSVGYLAYLVTGRRFFLEELQFAASWNSMSDPASVRGNGAGIIKSNAAGTIRHMAWLWRTLGQAIAATPDADTTTLTELRAQMTSNVDYYHARYIAQTHNPFGFVTPYEPAGAYGSSALWMGAPWMQDFATAAWGYSKDLAMGLSSAANAKLDALFAWKAQSIIGRLGSTGSTEFLYRDYGVYNIALTPSPNANWDTGVGPWYSNWGAIHAATFSGTEPNSGSSNSPYASSGANVDGNFRIYMNPEFPAADALPAIAYAVKHNIAGAQTAYQRLTSVAGWPAFLAELGAQPVWAVASGVFVR